MKNWLPLLSVLCIALGRPAHAAPDCEKLLKTPLARQMMPTAEDKKTLVECDAADDYYGLRKGEPDYALARRCAFVERERDWKFSRLGPGVLMMLFANGKGTGRNLDLAIRFACEMPEPERGHWIALLDGLKSSKERPNIDVCDHSFGDHDAVSCAEIRKLQQSAERERKFKAFAAKFTEKEKKGFDRLLEAARKFFAADAVWRNPQHATGLARSAQVHVQEAYAWEQFEIWIDHLEAEKHLKAPAESLAEIDERLNKQYRQHRASLNEVDKHDYVKAQRLWIDFRDAFVDFAVLRYEPKDTNTWHAEITRRRIDELSF